MGHWTIHYNKQGQPYIVQKNFGRSPESDESNSYWTWHITERGIAHLTTGPFGKPQKMPLFMNEDQLGELKSYGMLSRSDGSLVDRNPLYPSEVKKHSTTRPAKVTTPSTKTASKHAHPSAQPKKTARPCPISKPKLQRSPGLWSWLKSLFGLD